MKKVFFRQLFYVLLCTFSVLNIQSQNNYILPQVSPKSPNAAEFDKYGEIPVSLNNGTANISIPLYNIKVGSLDIPVTLTYNSNGLKVNEIPSFVGLGWSINAGGVINYEQRGQPDFSGNGLFAGGVYKSLDSLKRFLRNQMTPQRANAYLELLTEGEIDGEFDFYNFSFSGYSGSFYMDTNQRIIQVPASNLNIPDRNTIIDEKGNRYSFQEAEHNEIAPDPDPALALKRSFNANATYHLSSIQTADNRAVYFSYGSSPFTYSTSHKSVTVVSQRPNLNCPGNSQGTGYTYYHLNNKMLGSITFDGGRVVFELSTDYRNDIRSLDPNSNAPYLKKMKVYNSMNVLVTEYTFNYANTSRLLLAEVVRTDPVGTPARWTFQYNGGTDFGGLMTSGSDHWGYANGNPRGIPMADYASLVRGWTGNSTMVDKESNFGSGSNGMLQKITYPTGGSTSFSYQSNSVTFTSSSQGGPFLRRNYPVYYVPFISEDTYTQDIVEGSFTVTQPTLLRIRGFKWYQPLAFIESVVSLSHTPGGTNMLYSVPFGFTCTPWACEAAAIIQLSPGTYYYTLKKYPSDSGLFADGFASFDVDYVVKVPTFTYAIGGCRIAAMVHEDSLGNLTTKRYRYTDRYDSVGYFNTPDYISTVNFNTPEFGPGCSECGVKTTIAEESVKPLSGPPIEYLYVTEYSDNNGDNGVTEYSFTKNDNLNPGRGPYLSPFKTNWKAGLPVSKKQYRKSGDTMELVQAEYTGYEAVGLNSGVSSGVKSEYSDYCSTPGFGYRYYSYQTAVYRSEQFNTKVQSVVYYDEAGAITSASENLFTSTKHTLPTEIRTVNSSGDTLRERIKYSFDYDTTTITGNEAKAIRLLQRKNILVPIEKVAVKKFGGTDYVTQATIFTYKADTALIDRVFELLLTAPAAYAGFANSTITGGQLTKDNRYDEAARFIKYDEYNNVLQMQLTNNIMKSYLWDYNQQYPVCEVMGAAQPDIGFTSFETSNNGNWTLTGTALDSSFALTGRRSLNPGAGSISKANLSNGKQYIVSYWSRSGVKTITGASGSSKTGITTNGWTYYEHLVTTSGTNITLSGSGLIDELRLYPYGAQMNSFTYAPSIGITTHCDARNNILYYEYDGQNRLMHVRDVKRNVIKKVQYTFQASSLVP